MRYFLSIAFVLIASFSKGQASNSLISRSVQRMYQEYKVFFDSSLLSKHVVLDKGRSFYRNYNTQKIRSLAKGDSAFAFNEMVLSFAVTYLGDTLTYMQCTMDTMLHMLPLGTPREPRQHGDILPPYEMLVKGKLAFDNKKLKGLLKKMDIKDPTLELRSWLVQDDEKSTPNNPVAKKEYVWIVRTACPEIKCRELQVSATSGKILYDKQPEN